MFETAIQSLHDFIMANQQPFIILSWCILTVGIVQNIVYALQLPAAWLELRLRSQAQDSESSWQLLLSDVTIPISVIVPAYNEEVTIVESVRSLLSLEYNDFEVIVANDGSKDRTLEVLIEAFSMKKIYRAHQNSINHAPVKQLYGSDAYPNLIVIDKENGGGKADASNAALNYTRHPLFCVIDADSLLEQDSLIRSIRPFMEESEMVAVGGAIRILNGCTVINGQVKEIKLPKKILPLIQTLEYIRAFLMARLAWSRWGMLSIISGAFGIFKRRLAIEAGGFSEDTIGEDYDLVMKIHREMAHRKQPYSMRYVPEPVCWTEAPDTLSVLESQRRRWQIGALQVFFKNTDMVGRPRYGGMGMLALPHNFIVDVLGPIAELIGYILIPIFCLTGLLNVDFFLAFIGLFFVFGVFVSVTSLILEEMELRRFPKASDLVKLALVSVIENFGYRQINNIWRIKGWWDFLRKKQEWGTMTRTGFSGD